MASEQLHLTQLLEAVCDVLKAFDVSAGVSLLKRATTNLGNDWNNTQLLASLKQELTQLPPLASIVMNSEMRYLIRALIESLKATSVLDKKFLTRFINKVYHAFESFARNEIQRRALIDMQIAKEDAVGVELRHRVAHKLISQSTEYTQEQNSENSDDLQMTRELQVADY